MSNLEDKAMSILNKLKEFIDSANEACVSGNMNNLAINARSCVEQLCKVAFAQYTFSKDVTLKDQIDYLGKYNVLKQEEVELLHKIRVTGNAIVHGDNNIKYDIFNLYQEFGSCYDAIVDEIMDFLENNDKPQKLTNNNGGERFMKEYKFSDMVWGFEPKSTITIDGDMLHVGSKHGGTINLNQVTSVAFCPASAVKKGNLFFSFPGGQIGVYWSVLVDKKMNDNAQEIYSYVMQYVNRTKTQGSSQTVNNIINEKSPAEQVKELKELLDMGVITQEEFDKKKKELLGL